MRFVYMLYTAERMRNVDTVCGKREQINVLWNVVMPENAKDLPEGTS